MSDLCQKQTLAKTCFDQEWQSITALSIQSAPAFDRRLRVLPLSETSERFYNRHGVTTFLNEILQIFLFKHINQ